MIKSRLSERKERNKRAETSVKKGAFISLFAERDDLP